MENIYVEFKKEYVFCPGDDEPFRCRITLSLPSDRDGSLIPILRDRKRIFGWWLFSDWGGRDIDSGMRYVSISLKSSISWDDLSQEVDKMVEETTSQLREVIFENNHFLVTKPGDGVCVVNLTKDF